MSELRLYCDLLLEQVQQIQQGAEAREGEGSPLPDTEVQHSHDQSLHTFYKVFLTVWQPDSCPNHRTDGRSALSNRG